MTNSRQLAINECFLNGIGISGKRFDKELKKYNNFQMTLAERQKRIANKQEPEFIKLLKNKNIYYEPEYQNSDELNDFLCDLYSCRDNYSRGKIIEDIRAKLKELKIIKK